MRRAPAAAGDKPEHHHDVVVEIGGKANPPGFERPWVVAGCTMLYAAALLTLWTMVLYLRAAWPTLRSGFEQR